MAEMKDVEDMLFTNYLALTVLDSDLEDEMGSPLGFL